MNVPGKFWLRRPFLLSCGSGWETQSIKLWANKRVTEFPLGSVWDPSIRSLFHLFLHFCVYLCVCLHEFWGSTCVQVSVETRRVGIRLTETGATGNSVLSTLSAWNQTWVLCKRDECYSPVSSASSQSDIKRPETMTVITQFRPNR